MLLFFQFNDAGNHSRKACWPSLNESGSVPDPTVNLVKNSKFTTVWFSERSVFGLPNKYSGSIFVQGKIIFCFFLNGFGCTKWRILYRSESNPYDRDSRRHSFFPHCILMVRVTLINSDNSIHEQVPHCKPNLLHISELNTVELLFLKKKTILTS